MYNIAFLRGNGMGKNVSKTSPGMGTIIKFKKHWSLGGWNFPLFHKDTSVCHM